MATGLGIRGFFKEYRELRYSDSGSIRLTEVEHNAYVNRLTVEITNFDAPRAINFKTLPENTHWGYLTSFKGSSVLENTPVKFVKQRVFDLTNSAIWQYHQHKENADVTTGAIQTYGNLALGELSSLGDGVGIVGILINAVEGLEDITAPVFAWLYEQVTGGESLDDAPTKAYTAYPIASPFPDVFKFKSDIPLSFLFRLESWYLVNPAVYITSNPTDSGDATEGEDEYPTPLSGDGDGDGSEFPFPDAPDPDSDPRDYDERNQGSQGTWRVSIRYFDAGNNVFCDDVANATFTLAGYEFQRPRYEERGAVTEFGSRAAYLVTSLAEVKVGETCGTAITGLPFFIRPAQ